MTGESYQTLQVDIDGAAARITIDRAEALNALNAQVFADLSAAFGSLAGRADVRVIVLTGAGERAFVAGADIKEMVDMMPVAAEQRSWKGMRLYDQIRQQPQPVIARIHGYALGGGMLLAMACDLRVAARSATFGYPEIRLGIFPGTGGTVLIDRLIGPAAARAICLTGEHFSAERAFHLGLVTHLVDDADVDSETGRLRDLLAGYSPVALRELKQVLNASIELDFKAARAAEVAAYGRCFASDDRREGMQAFIDKRPARFRGS